MSPTSPLRARALATSLPAPAGRAGRSAWLLATLLALAVAGCVPVGADDDDSALDDDDSAPPADDDDSAAGDDDDDVHPITSVTFASSMDGAALTVPPGQTGAASELVGTFQVIYWESLEDQRMYCRQRFAWQGLARFGDQVSNSCPHCSGQIQMTAVQALDPSNFDDGCDHLPPEIDLSFLLVQDDLTVPSDFRVLTLVEISGLQEAGWSVGVGGMGTDQLVDRYQMAGLDVLHVAFVEPGGWLDDEAGLAGVATGWGGAGLLPMFTVYTDPDAQDASNHTLVGRSFLSTLWTVRVGAGLGAEQLP